MSATRLPMVAERLRRAYAEGSIAPVRGELDGPTADLAYEIQDINTRHSYVRGYRLKQRAVFDVISADQPLAIPGYGKFHGLKTSVFLEVAGAADYLPAYAGNLDIMTSAALGTGERVARAKYLQAAA